MFGEADLSETMETLKNVGTAKGCELLVELDRTYRKSNSQDDAANAVEVIHGC
jgi:hypothetical protein